MGDPTLKEVEFENYCKNCKEWDTNDWEDPCNECINTPVREGTRVPLNYEKGGK